MNYDNDPLRDDEDDILNDDLDLDADPDRDAGGRDFYDAVDPEPEPDATSEPEPADADRDTRPAAPSTSSRRLFKIEKEEPEDDYYDGEPEEPEEPERKPKTPKLDPEDPDYWIDDNDSPIGNIFTKPRKAWKWWLAGIAVAVLLIGFAWIWFMRPYTDGAVKYGYLKHMERRGTVLKTFEGVLIPYRELGDPTPFYFEEVRFSVEGDSLAALMKGMMLGCVPVRLEYEVYHSPLPWKGAEKMVVVKADTADTSRILPPEYR